MGGRRLVALIVTVVMGALALPLSATVLDREGTENLILPVALLLSGGVGALAGGMVPRAGQSSARSAVVGALVGLIACLASLLVLFFLISGLSGA